MPVLWDRGEPLSPLWVAAAWAGRLAVVEDAPVRTLVTNVRVLDTSGRTGDAMDVVLAEGRIESVGPVGDAWAPDVVVVDGAGKTLLPGLVDAHVHIESTFALPGRIRVPNPRRNLEAFALAGVTTVLDLSLARDRADDVAERVSDGSWVGPALFRSGRPFGAPDGHPTASIRAVFPGLLVRAATAHGAFSVATAADVDRAVALEGQTGFKKVMLHELPPGAPEISDEALARLRVAATALGDRLVAHVGTPDDVDRALAVGADALVHAPCCGVLRDEQIATLATYGVPVVPTIGVWDAVGTLHADRMPEAPIDVGGRPEDRVARRGAAGKGRFRPPMDVWASDVVASTDARRTNARRLYDAGVTVLVGSDSPGLGHRPGAATHQEIDRLIEAGLPPADVLAAATWQGSRFLDPNARFGAVRPGYEADLILVEGDAGADATAVHRIDAVWLDGRRVTPRRAR